MEIVLECGSVGNAVQASVNLECKADSTLHFY